RADAGRSRPRRRRRGRDGTARGRPVMTRSGVRDRAAPPRDAGPEIPDRLRVRAIAALEAGPRGVLPLLAGVGVVTGSAGLALLLGRGGPAPPRGNVAA